MSHFLLYAISKTDCRNVFVLHCPILFCLILNTITLVEFMTYIFVFQSLTHAFRCIWEIQDLELKVKIGIDNNHFNLMPVTLCLLVFDLRGQKVKASLFNHALCCLCSLSLMHQI